ATTLASLRQQDWDVPATIERLAGTVALSRRADRAAAASKGRR
ncbi:AAA family ATPase, partial [Streptomyces sp. SID5470]|nr:AAA family ATPase [Streptomyces sp. SID5470]